MVMVVSAAWLPIRLVFTAPVLRSTTFMPKGSSSRRWQSEIKDTAALDAL